MKQLWALLVHFWAWAEWTALSHLQDNPVKQVRNADGNGATALHVVLEHRQQSSADLLAYIMRHGDISARDAVEVTPVHLAAGYPSATRQPGAASGLDLVNAMLKEKPEAVAWTTSEGKTPLFGALKNGEEVIKALSSPEVMCLNVCTLCIALPHPHLPQCVYAVQTCR